MNDRTMRITRRLAAFAGGATLLQAGGCSLDANALLTQVTNAAIQAFFTALASGFVI